jgi:hypothetical protein
MSAAALTSFFALIFGVSILACLAVIFSNGREPISSIACGVLGVCGLLALLFLGAIHDLHVFDSSDNCARCRSGSINSPQGAPARPQVDRSGRAPRPPGQSKAPPAQTEA